MSDLKDVEGLGRFQQSEVDPDEAPSANAVALQDYIKLEEQGRLNGILICAETLDGSYVASWTPTQNRFGLAGYLLGVINSLVVGDGKVVEVERPN